MSIENAKQIIENDPFVEMEAKMENKFNRKNESTVERFIYRYRLTGFLLKDCRNDDPTHLIQH
jgi:hypothetical protein